jgi:hypothetical protein
MKWLAILAIVLFAIEPIPAHKQISGQRPARQSQQDAQSPPAPSIGPITNNQATAYYQQNSADKPHGWHKFLTWPEGITAWLIMLTLGAIIWQAWETRKAAQAALKSVRLQEVQLRQWVEIDDWKTSAPYIQPTMKEADLTILFRVFNPTKIPLTLKSIVAAYGPTWEPKLRRGKSSSMQYALAPDSGYPMDLILPMNADLFSRYKEKQLVVAVSIDVGFEDLFDKRRDQKFVFTGKCGPMGWCEFTVSHNTHAVEQDDQKPN